MSPQAHYWDTVARAWHDRQPQALWRVHSDAIYTALFAGWLPDHEAGRLLKTDLFDEVYGQGLYPLLASRGRNVIGMDISAMIARAARSRYSALKATEADARCLPFGDGTFDVIVSNSTLDHFETLDEVVVGLRELHRVLRLGGQLLLSLDNLANPAIAIRNALPPWLLKRLHAVPFYVGATCGPRRLQTMLIEIGFDVLEVRAVMHHPSVIAVRMARVLQHRSTQKTQWRFLSLLMALERLSRWPTRFLTGHYVAVKAVKH